MLRKTHPALPVRLVGHLGMGAALGIVLGFCLVHFNIAHVGEIIGGAVEPTHTLGLFMTFLVLECGIGATLTGFVLIKLDENEQR